MIGYNFTTLGNNRLKLTQFSHTPEITLFLTLFYSTRATLRCECRRGGWSTAVREASTIEKEMEQN